MKSFESVIPTALHTAYPLIFTDIPYSKEIYEVLAKDNFAETLKNDKLAFEIEARYKLIDKFLEESGIVQILEIASGFTARGLNICLENKNAKYVEFDLPKVIKEKVKILKKITKVPSNLHFVAGNALNFDDISKAIAYFDTTKPIAVINQGLMRYLSFDEKQKLTENVYNIISKNNGIWLTCDFTPAKFLVTEDKNISKTSNTYNEDLTKVTSRNNPAWRFADKEEVEKFLKANKLKIEWHDFIESISLLSSTKYFSISDNDVKPFLQNAYVSIIRPL